MDFDPGECFDDSEHYESRDEMAEDAYEEGYDDGQDDMESNDEEVEFDSLGNPIYLAIGASLGHEMAQGEVDERQIAEDILRRREGKQGKPVKVPLAQRHTAKGYVTPFGRWATKSNIDHGKNKDELEYTKEERLRIMESEGDWDG